MTLHWMHVTAAYALVVGGFGVLTVSTVLRQRAARARLAMLDTRVQARGRAA